MCFRCRAFHSSFVRGPKSGCSGPCAFGAAATRPMKSSSRWRSASKLAGALASISGAAESPWETAQRRAPGASWGSVEIFAVHAVAGHVSERNGERIVQMALHTRRVELAPLRPGRRSQLLQLLNHGRASCRVAKRRHNRAALLGKIVAQLPLKRKPRLSGAPSGYNHLRCRKSAA
jgi:hypothetical protein